MQDIVNAITMIGFPIVAYLLVYLDLRKLIISNTETIQRLTNVIAKEGLNVQDIKTSG